MSFLTAGEPEVRAWTIKKGTKAPEAAGKIHSDIQRGFIKAEIVSYSDLISEGSMVAAREKGLVRSEGNTLCKMAILYYSNSMYKTRNNFVTKM